MALISKETVRVTQSFIENAVSYLNSMGLDCSVHTDFHEWAELLKSVPDGEPLSPTLDPDKNYIEPGAGFWISFNDPSGNIIACAGSRRLQTENLFLELVTTQLLFGDLEPRLSINPMELSDNPPEIKGRVGFAGGVWVHPTWRDKDLAALASKLGRTIGLTHLLVDFHVGLVAATERRRAWARTKLLWPRRADFCKGLYPARGKEMDVDIHYQTAAETVAMCRTENLAYENRGLKVAG